jgi:hypothetical protein
MRLLAFYQNASNASIGSGQARHLALLSKDQLWRTRQLKSLELRIHLLDDANLRADAAE